MKNKILAFLLVTVMMFSFVNISYAEDTSSVSYSKDFGFALALGIVPDDVVPGEAVKRIDLACIYSNILMPDGTPELYVPSRYFTDVEYAVSGYADTVFDAGIMNGVGEGRFSPDGYVTYNQFIKTIVSFLGYDVKAQSMGGYPAGYMSVAASLGIVADLNGGSGEDFVTGEMVAYLFKAALNAPLFEQTGYGTDSQTYTQDVTINYLSKYMGIYRRRGVVKAVHGTNLINNEELKYNEIIVDKTKMSYNPEEKDLSQKLGLNADVYYKLNGSEAEIVWFEEYENNVIKISGEEIIESSAKLSYYEGNKEKKIKTNGYTQIVYNGSLSTSYTSTVLNPWTSGIYDGSLTAVDNNADGVFDYIFIDAYETYTVSSVNETKIIPMYRENTIIDLGDYEDGKDVLIRNLSGEPVSLASVESGSIISVSKDLNNKVKSVIVTIDECVGILESYEIGNGIHYFTVGGETFRSSNSLKKNPQLEKIQTGKNIKLMFNKDGQVSDIEVLKYQINSIGYVVDFALGTGLAAKDDVQLRMFTSGGVFENFHFAEKINTFYGLENKRLSPMEVISRLGITSSGELVRQPVYYQKNENGEINQIQICNNDDGEIDGFYRFHGTVLDSTPSEYEYRSSSLGGKVLIKGTVIFSVPSEEKRDQEELYQIQKLYAGQFYTIEAYGTKKNSRVASVGVISNAESKTFYNPLGVIIIDSITEAIDPEGNEAMKIKGFADGGKVEYFVEKLSMLEATGNVLPQSGDIIRLTLHSNGSVSKFELIFDESEREFPNYSSNPTSSYSSGTRYLYGEIIWSDEESMNVKATNKSTGVITEDAYLKSPSYKYYKISTVRNGEKLIETAGPDDFMVYTDVANGEKGPNIFMYTASGDLKVVVIYE